MKMSKAKPQEEKTTVRGKLISISEAVERYPMKKDWYYNHMKHSTLPIPWYPLSVGKRYLDTADIESWLELRKVPAGSKPGDIKGAV